VKELCKRAAIAVLHCKARYDSGHRNPRV